VAGLGFLWLAPVIDLWVRIILVLLAIAIARGAGLLDRLRRAIAFRADRQGILLGAVPDKLSPRRGSALFLPWSDVEQIVLYPASTLGPRKSASAQCIGIQRKAGAAPLLWGNEQAPGCPVPRVPTWATRPITGWRLDRNRLAATVAEVAPDVSILVTGPGTSGRSPAAATTDAAPAD
jgi:hypothetical protein